MKIRIGNDVKIKWVIKKNNQPYDLTNKKIIVQMLDATKRKVAIEHTIENNSINIIYRGKDQYEVGGYSLLLIENRDDNNMTTIDYLKAFELVRHSSQTDYSFVPDGVTIEIPEITSNVKDSGETIVGPEGPAGKDGITPHIGSNGNWYIGNEDTGIKAQGPKGTDGKDGATGPAGEKGDKGDKGETGAVGPKGADGTNGKDGHSPVVTIGDNGNWFIDGVDQNKPSRGENGTDATVKEWVGTQSEYEAIEPKDAETKYYIIEG